MKGYGTRQTFATGWGMYAAACAALEKLMGHKQCRDELRRRQGFPALLRGVADGDGDAAELGCRVLMELAQDPDVWAGLGRAGAAEKLARAVRAGAQAAYAWSSTLCRGFCG